MHNNEVEEDGEHEGGWVAICDAFSRSRVGSPGWAENATFDVGVYFCGVGFRVGYEELSVKLGEDVSNTV